MANRWLHRGRGPILALIIAALASGCARNGPPAPVVSGLSAPATALVSAARAETVRVQPGDSLSKIAKRENVVLQALIQANGIAPPYRIYPGQTLVLPRSDTQVGQVRVAARESVAVEPMPSPLAAEPAPGSVDARITAERVPDRPAVVAAAVPASIATDAAIASGVGRDEPPVAAEEARLDPVRAAVALHPPKLGPLGPPPAREGRSFQWPLRGKILAPYGPREKGYFNDGINIAAAAGAPVHAAESGVVVYAGNEIKGFGNLLLIKHADGWVTAYAHNESMLVTRGDTVRRGQRIARVGTSGGVSRPQLHFEIRRGARSVDPLRYLAPAATADSSGPPAETAG